MKRENKNKKKSNKKSKKKVLKGFTLIELLAVIVILGILMLIAIPSVTKYIEQSRKKAFITSINNIAGAVRYGVVSDDEKYSMSDATEKTFELKDVETEKGKLNDVEGYIKVIKTPEGYEYKVKVNGSTTESKNYCCDEVDIKDLGNNLIKCSSNSSTLYEAYSIGDTIEFAGSNWKVIKNSTNNEDYVTVIKETVLTNSELGSYAYNSTYNTMEFTWTGTCHNANHGYSSANTSGCSNTNSYTTSKIKEFLEGTYINTLGASNLKEIDGYKIRLITENELIDNLGCTSSGCSSSPYKSWVYENCGTRQGNVWYYWTMTPYSNYGTGIVLTVNYTGGFNKNAVYDNSMGVRPVINLLKSSI